MPFTIIHPKTARPVADYAMAARVDFGRPVPMGTVGPFLGDGRVACPGDLAGQTRMVFDNLIGRLHAVEAELSDIVKMTTYLSTMSDFPAFARVRSEFLSGRMPPATLIQVPRFVHPDVLVQVQAIALVR